MERRRRGLWCETGPLLRKWGYLYTMIQKKEEEKPDKEVRKKLEKEKPGK